jgi:UDP-N-acetylglucosamine transferase subunit ALG13
MNFNINMTALAGKKLLVAPLDWGLGHATRCIPIIKELLAGGCEVWLAGEGHQEVLLSKEFPTLNFLPLKGYRVKYASVGMMVKILMQVPKILSAIKEENNWLKEQVNKFGFDAVISDNRYGLYHKKIHSVFITHQLTIKTPLGKWSENFLHRWNYRFINRFSECWIPDEEDDNNLAGELSHPEIFPAIPVKYTGALSRFSFSVPMYGSGFTKNHILIILSGPEPQRSLFENIIVKQIVHYNGTATIVRGMPLATDILPSTNTIRFYNHLTTDLLNEEMTKAEFIISRCGYSTVMDIAVMKKKSILIPTPGQTEQEYLAGYLMNKRFAFCVNQKVFSLNQSIEKARAFEYRDNL